mgnify:CR=1 FL=1
MTKLILGALVALVVVGCGGAQSVETERKIVDRQQDIYNRVQPMPLFDYSQDRNTLIQVYNAKNEARQTWAVDTALDGTPIWSCPSYGFPIPVTTQLTNPEQQIGTGVTVPQAEPNGLYTGQTTATYVLCIRPNGDVVPIYAEQDVLLFPFEVRIEDGRIVDAGGASTMTVSVKGGTSSTAPAPEPSK